MNFRSSFRALALAGVGVLATALTPQIASGATLTYTVTEVSGNVQVAVSGNLTSALWTFGGAQSVSPNQLLVRSDPGSFTIFAYVSPTNSGGNRDAYAPAAGVSVVGPNGFGTDSTGNTYQTISSATGATIAGFAQGSSANSFSTIYVPTGVNIQTGALGANFTVTGETFTTMGLTAGTYSWVFTGTGAQTGLSDTIQLNIGGASGVPDTGVSAAGVGLSLAALCALRGRRAGPRKV
jgi:hypothetical protein